MLHSIRKYTPLLKRCFVFLLCICLIFSVFYKPQKVNASYAALASAGMSAIVSVFFSSDFVYDSTSDLVHDVQEIWNSLSEVDWDLFKDAETKAQTSGSFKLSPKMRLIIITALAGVWSAGKMLGKNIAVQSEEDIEEVIVEAETELRLPTAEMIAQPSLSYQTQLIVETNSLLKVTNNLLENVKTALHTLHTKLDTFYTEFASYRKGVGTLLNAINSNTYTELRNIHLLINNNVIGWLDTINKNLHDDMYMLHNDLKVNISKEVDKLNVMQQEIVDAVSSVQLGIDQLFEVFTGQVVTSVEGVQQGVQTLVDTYTEVYKDQLVVTKPQVEVQVGAQTLVVSDYATLSNAFSAKMAWVPQIFDFLAELRSRLDPGSAPKISLDFSTAGGTVDWGESTYVLDLSWYEPFKPYFDTFISGCLWLCFGWAIYKRIPDILSGVGLTVENATQPQGHVWSDRSERAASLQYLSDRRQDYYKRRGG